MADNARRVNNIIAPAHRTLLKGMIFQAVKGCHPFDLESMTLERRLRDEGFKFIKLETDYTSEESQNPLTRLEALETRLKLDRAHFSGLAAVVRAGARIGRKVILSFGWGSI